jgi:hypothetical protein
MKQEINHQMNTFYQVGDFSKFNDNLFTIDVVLMTFLCLHHLYISSKR